MTVEYDTEEFVKKFCGAARSEAAVIGPLTWHPAAVSHYPGVEEDDDVWYVIVAASRDSVAGPQHFHDVVELGFVEDEPDAFSQAIMRHAKNVITLRRPNDRTRTEASETRQSLIKILASHFDQVHVMSDELEMAYLCERLWPGGGDHKATCCNRSRARGTAT